jgi:hypothetical protein
MFSVLSVCGSLPDSRLLVSNVKNMEYVRFKVLTETSMKMTAFWDIPPPSLV